MRPSSQKVTCGPHRRRQGAPVAVRRQPHASHRQRSGTENQSPESPALVGKIIKGSLVAPESSWFYAPSHAFRMLQNPESLENDPNHVGIAVESHLNHSIREAANGVAVNHIPPLGSAALGWLHAVQKVFARTLSRELETKGTLKLH